MDISGKIPKELDYRSAIMYGGGTGGPVIPIPIPYDEIPYDEDTLKEWAEENGYASELEFLEAISDISEGADHVKDGIKCLFIPMPTLADDLYGIAVATYGVLQTSGGIVKTIIWAFDQWDKNEGGN